MEEKGPRLLREGGKKGAAGSFIFLGRESNVDGSMSDQDGRGRGSVVSVQSRRKGPARQKKANSFPKERRGGR